jgi:hypothetical protein
MLTQPGDARWYLDPDLFAEEIADLDLSDRANRALREALTSFPPRVVPRIGESARGRERGSVVRGWRADWNDPIVKAIEDGATARLQTRVAEHLRGMKAVAPALPDGLLAHAALLREIRNYGVHPKETRDDLERWFTEEACGLLLLQTHHYLTRLAGAVEMAVSAHAEA